MLWLYHVGFGMKIVQLVTAGPSTCCNKSSKVEKYHVSINTKPEHQRTTDCITLLQKFQLECDAAVSSTAIPFLMFCDTVLSLALDFSLSNRNVFRPSKTKSSCWRATHNQTLSQDTSQYDNGTS